jgi:hypothetical protein
MVFLLCRTGDKPPFVIVSVGQGVGVDGKSLLVKGFI